MKTYPYKKRIDPRMFKFQWKFGYVLIYRLDKKIYYIDYLNVYPRYMGKGHSHTILTHITRWADKNRLALKLIYEPSRYDSFKPLSLRRLYNRYGFKTIGHIAGHPRMIRKARS